MSSNKYERRGDHAALLIPTTDGRTIEVLVDANRLDAVLAFGVWHIGNFSRKGEKLYAYLRDHRGMTYMHRMITGAPAGTIADHRDGNGLNNRDTNLRVTTGTINQLNRARGVPRNPRNGKWLARVQVNRRTHSLGQFANRADAVERVRLFLVEMGVSPEVCQ